MIVAITGCIGSGKSFILSLINKTFNYKTFSSDDFVMLSYDDEKIKKELDKEFNCLVNNKVDKAIIKKQLNEEKIKRLNEIIHPFVKEKIIYLAKQYENDLVFVEVPLLFETNMNTLFDYSIAISTNDEFRHQKLKERNINNYENMLKLEKFQFSNEKKKENANFIIESNFNKDENIIQLKKVIEKIKNK